MLRFVTKDNGDGSSECSVVEDATGTIVGRATSKNTAAGGTSIECLDFLADGRIIRFSNSRGVYAKDARLGSTNDRTLPCGDGAFAGDVTTCVELDATPYFFDSDAPSSASVPFDVKLCAISNADCKTLVTIQRGLNRSSPKRTRPRWWDVRYCSDDRVLVLAEGKLRLFEAPSGKLLSEAPSGSSVRIVHCGSGSAKTIDEASRHPLSFTLDRTSLRPAP